MSSASYTAAHSIPPHALSRLAREWLEEDTPNFDPAGVCVGSQEVEARLLCKTPHSILAGTPFFTAVFAEVGCTVDWIFQDGSEIGSVSALNIWISDFNQRLKTITHSIKNTSLFSSPQVRKLLP